MVAPGCGALMIDLETGHLVDECLTGCALLLRSMVPENSFQTRDAQAHPLLGAWAFVYVKPASWRSDVLV